METLKRTDQLSYSYIGRLEPGKIAKQPILDTAARFWESERYEAFRTCYRSMRWIDDMVDHEKSSTPKIIASKVKMIETTIRGWLEAIRTKVYFDSRQKDLADILDYFRIPLDPWYRFMKAMLYDLRHDGFSSVLSFSRYCNGAAIAPASIFMHLCGISKAGEGYRRPGYDSFNEARPLAMFSYLVHIIRDFQKDHLSNLNYFPDRILKKYRLTREELRAIAEGGEIGDNFRAMIDEYVRMGEYYRRRSKEMMTGVLPNLDGQYSLSLEVIYQLYLQIFERIDPAHGRFTGEELNPSPGEVKNRVERVIETYAPA